MNISIVFILLLGAISIGAMSNHRSKRQIDTFGLVRPSLRACQTYLRSSLRPTTGIEITETGEFPWMVALFVRKGIRLRYECSGAIISDRFVLTTGHCAMAKPNVVRLGHIFLAYYNEVNPLHFGIEEIIEHPVNDIALIKLNKPITFTDVVRPVCLHSDTADLDANIKLVVAAWGTTSPEQVRVSKYLLKEDVETVALPLCNLMFEAFKNQLGRVNNESLSTGQYCALSSRDRNHFCQGTEGGLLHVFSNETTTVELVGLARNISSTECGTISAGIYTRVAEHLLWIELTVWPTELSQFAIETAKEPQKPRISGVDESELKASPLRAAAKACQLFHRFSQLSPPNRTVQAQLGEFPWMAAVYYLDLNAGRGRYGCSGSIISDRFVLIAASCEKSDKQLLFVRLGSTTLTIDKKVNNEHYPIEATIPHPGYSDGTRKNDIALIRLSRSIRFSDNIKPICLHTSVADIDPNQKLVMPAWSSVSYESETIDKNLLKGGLVTIPLSQCSITLDEFNVRAKREEFKDIKFGGQYCAYDQNGRKFPCKGSLGAPLVVNETTLVEVVAFNSFGVGCGSGLPGVFTRVAHYLDWIEPIVWPSLISNETQVTTTESPSTNVPTRASPKIDEEENNTNRITNAKQACQMYTILPKSRIIGGIAPISDFPWIASLGHIDDNDFTIHFDCSGTIISDLFVLTASHCTRDNRLPSVIRVGQNSRSNEDDEFPAINYFIAQTITHPEYSRLRMKNDIALIRVARRINFNDYVMPACLQTDINDLDHGTDLIAMDWITSGTQWDLLKITMRTLPIQECNATLVNYNTTGHLVHFENGISQGQYCAHESAIHSNCCQGKSGGPLQYFTSDGSSLATIVGVTSFSIASESDLLTIFTRVAFYVDWIESIVWPESE